MPERPCVWIGLREMMNLMRNVGIFLFSSWLWLWLIAQTVASPNFLRDLGKVVYYIGESMSRSHHSLYLISTDGWLSKYSRKSLNMRIPTQILIKQTYHAQPTSEIIKFTFFKYSGTQHTQHRWLIRGNLISNLDAWVVVSTQYTSHTRTHDISLQKPPSTFNLSVNGNGPGILKGFIRME